MTKRLGRVGRDEYVRATAVGLVDDVIDERPYAQRAKAIQAAWGASKPTSYKILKEREKYTRDGRRR